MKADKTENRTGQCKAIIKSPEWIHFAIKLCRTIDWYVQTVFCTVCKQRFHLSTVIN